MAAVFNPHDHDDGEPVDAATPPTPTSAEPGGLTRRRVVQAGVTVGAAAWLGGMILPSGAVAAAEPGRLTVRRTALLPGRTIGPIAAPHRFDLLGAPVATVAGVGLQIRGRLRGGTWSTWQELNGHDGHAPDGRRARMSDPVWFGRTDEIQLRVRRPVPHDLRLELVAVAPTEQRAAGRATARAVATGGIARAATSRASGGASADLRAVPTIIPRSAWGPGLKPRTGPQMGEVLLAFVHHTVNANTYSQTESAAIVRAITEYHVRSNGWNDVGYNFLVDRFGQIFEGRAGGIDQAVVGAQAVGWNSVSTGIAIIGTFDGTPAPDAALNAVASLIGWKLGLHGTPTSGTIALVSSGGSGNRYKSGTHVALNRVSGHRDGCSTDCPGHDLYGQLDTIRGRVGDGGPTTTLSITVPEEPVRYGEQVTVQGRLTSAGVAVAGARVTVQKRSPSRKWVPMTQATTDADGRWDASIVLRAASAVRARANGVTSPSVTPGLDPRLGLRQPTRRMHARRTVLASGTAHGVATVTATLRRQQGDRYIVVARETLRVKGGKFHGRLPVRRPGKHRLTIESTSGKRTYHSRNRYLRAV